MSQSAKPNNIKTRQKEKEYFKIILNKKVILVLLCRNIMNVRACVWVSVIVCMCVYVSVWGLVHWRSLGGGTNGPCWSES